MRKGTKIPVSISDIIGKSVGMRSGDKAKLFLIGKSWDDIIGWQISAHSHPTSFKYGVLHVTVDSPSWIQELSFLKNKIMENIRRDFKSCEVKDIRFKYGELPAIVHGVQRRKHICRSLSKDEIGFVEDAVKEIDDSEIRDAAKRAMVKFMSTKDVS